MKTSYRLSSTLPAELKPALKILSKRYPALSAKDAPILRYVRNSDPAAPSTAMPEKKGWTIYYKDVSAALRLTGQLLAGALPPAENSPFETLGVMIDCSRNAVRTVPYLKTVFERLAILGYNLVMLYCEDTYVLDGENCFGLHRGGYTAEDIREIDSYAAALGIEVVPCIQTLGHLEQIFRWKPYNSINDTSSVLMVGEKESYKLIEKMIKFWSNNVRSRKIHLGMDEAWGIGKGEYMKRHGERPKFDIMCEHLAEVCTICSKYDLKPYMWSDMWFRIACGDGSSYGGEKDVRIPKEVADRIPKELTLCYWDYYTDKKAIYDQKLAAHKAIGQTQMSSGVWTWGTFWHAARNTNCNVPPCVMASREAGVKEILFTSWGDDGGFCDFESAFAGYTFASAWVYGGEANWEMLQKQYAALFDGASYEAIQAMGAWQSANFTALVWDDPLMNIAQGQLRYNSWPTNHDTTTWEDLYEGLKAVRRTLAKAKVTKNGNGGSIPYAKALADYMFYKMKAFETLTSTRPNTPAKRRAAAKAALPSVRAYTRAIHEFYDQFIAMWQRQNRPQGLETIQIRLQGCAVRADEALRRIGEFVRGKADDLPELVDIVKVLGSDYSQFLPHSWYRTAHGTVIG